MDKACSAYLCHNTHSFYSKIILSSLPPAALFFLMAECSNPTVKKQIPYTGQGFDYLLREGVSPAPIVRRRRFAWGFAVIASLAIATAGSCLAELAINPCQPITHRVVVQPIRANKADGTAATFMGNLASQTYIKRQVNRIWSQVGVTVEWRPLFEFTDDFSYDGSPTDYSVVQRPSSDLDAVLTGAGAPLTDTTGLVVNAFFVGICPGANLSQSGARGLARVDQSGMCISLASSLMDTELGRDAAASIIAHEIGHNLGLLHYLTNSFDPLFPPNLMSSFMALANPPGRLIAAQKTILFDIALHPYGGAGFALLQPYTPTPTYAAWAALLGVTGGPGDDDDGDGLPNAFEFLHGSCPLTPGIFPASTPDESGLAWQFLKQPQAVGAGYTYLIETSTDLSVWKTAGSPGSGSTVLTDLTGSISIRLNYSAGPAAFLRVAAHIAPEN